MTTEKTEDTTPPTATQEAADTQAHAATAADTQAHAATAADTQAHAATAADTPTRDLGVEGKDALKAERQARREAEQAARAASEKLAALERKEVLRGVAEEKGLTAEQAAFLTGESRDELAASADALLAAFPPAPDGGAAAEVRRVPSERLVPGTGAQADDELNAGSLAERVMRL